MTSSSSSNSASAPDSFFTATLAEADLEIAAAIKGELGRQRHEVELIASEIIVYNLSLLNTRQDIVRTVLEGVALNTRWLLSPVEKFLGHGIISMHIVGCGAQSISGARFLQT